MKVQVITPTVKLKDVEDGALVECGGYYIPRDTYIVSQRTVYNGYNLCRLIMNPKNGFIHTIDCDTECIIRGRLDLT